MFERILTGAAVLALLAMGAGVIPVASVFPVVAAATILLAGLLLRLVTHPEWHVQRDRLLPLVRAGIPIGVVTLLFTVMLKLDTVLLSLLTNSHDVGIYGSAYRLFESTMFLSWSLGAAIFPWFSRVHPERVDELRRGYETSVLVMLGLLVPVGVAFLLLAEPIINVIYGAAYEGAVLPLRLLSFVVVCYGLNAITSNVLTAHDRPGLMHRVLLITLVQNIVMNLVLIPPYGPTGAAMSAAVSGLLLGALTLRQAATALGSIHLTRIFLAPVLGGTAMALVVLLVRADLLQGLLFGIAAYALAFLLAERALISRGYEIGLLVMLSILTPIGVACTVLAAPIVHTLYGTRYDESITPLRLLGAVVIAFGINTFTSSTLAANDRPRLMHSILLITVFQNIVMNALLIPPYGATGAALTAAVSGLLLGAPQHSPGDKDAWARAPDPGFSRSGGRRRGDGGRRHTRPGLARREPLPREQRLLHRAADHPARVLPR